ncbi:MAG TPA: HD domain-containing protein [Gemmatimonadota bacterium]|nr:HD domain-containing protein [Gemmatimonadota bacterium]
MYRKRIFCADLKLADQVHEVFCVTRVERRQGRSGAPFLRLAFSDRTGTVAGVAWDDIETMLGVLAEGRYARVRGDVGDYRGEAQLRVVAAEPVVEPLDPAEFLPRGPVPAERSLAKIRGLVDSISDAHLKQLVLGFLDDPEFARSFAAAPAAMIHHHAYTGGLAEHTLSVMELCARAADHYPDLDRDLILAGAFCHDLGKVVELAVLPGFPYTEEGALLGHIPLGYALVRERVRSLPGFPPERAIDLGHLVLSHQGELEWGSPVRPQTLEALVLHYLDNLDSKVATARAHLDTIERGRTGYVRSLGRSLFRRSAGSAALDDAVERPAPPDGDPAGGGGGVEEAGPTLFDDLDRATD